LGEALPSDQASYLAAKSFTKKIKMKSCAMAYEIFEKLSTSIHLLELAIKIEKVIKH
jgi:hypothetical protein